MERPAKATIRSLWMDRLGQAKADWDGSGYLYLTLCGAEGRDIQAALEAGIIGKNEVGGISNTDLGTCVAVEREPEAVLRLQSRHPGLRILEQPVENIVSGESPMAWPVAGQREVSRSKVLNIDLNSSFPSKIKDGQVRFPIALWLHKLMRMHAVSPPIDWTLYLTLNASLGWDDATWQHVLRVLSQNMTSHPDFNAGMHATCQIDLATEIENGTCIMSDLDYVGSQNILMAFVPKALCQDLPDGWTMEVLQNIRYGGESSDVAPMVSLVVDFCRDSSVLGLRDVGYRKSVSSIFTSTRVIDSGGSISACV